MNRENRDGGVVFRERERREGVTEERARDGVVPTAGVGEGASNEVPWRLGVMSKACVVGSWRVEDTDGV
jgi:hypothetical protein